MAKKKKTGDYLQKVQLPLKGLSEQFAYGDQPAGTTAGAINVRSVDPRTGRRRLASRSGLSKYASSQVNGNASIQDITSITIAKSSLVGPGNVIAVGSSSTTVRVMDVAQNVIYNATIGYNSSAASATFMEVDGSGYLFGIDNTVRLQVSKTHPNGTLAWSMNSGIFGAGTWHPTGIASDSSYLYLYSAVGANATIHRLYKSNGTMVSGSAFISNSTGLGGFSVLPRKCMAVSSGVIGVLNNSGFQRFLASNGGLLGNTSLAPADTPKSVTVDLSGNFYASSSQGLATSQRLAKIDSSGSILWSSNGTNTSVPEGLDYDVTLGMLRGVGAPPNYRTYHPGNGTISVRSNITIGDSTTLVSVAADGSNGCFVGGDDAFARVLADDTVSWTQNTTAEQNFRVSSTNAETAETGNRMASTRSTIGLVTAGGTVVSYSNGSLASITSGSAISPTAEVVFSATNGLFVYYVDGTQYKRFNATTRAMESWTASNGSLPVDSFQESCRLICTWRGRTVLAGLRGDPQNWFMSAVDNPRNWNYAPSPTLATQAVAGNNAEAGLVGDLINCMIPYSDDLLIFGCDHSIWVMRGDPMAGGQIDRVSDTIGMAWGRPFCKDPTGAIYFFGSRGGIYRMQPGSVPERISQAVEERLADVDLAATIIRMAWDDRQKGFHLFLTPLTSSAEATHYWYDQRSGAWWADEFADTDHNPKAVYLFDADNPDDRVVLIGSWDGYLRTVDREADDDDGAAITSHVFFGPLNGSTDEVLHLKELQAQMAETAGNVTWSVHTGSSEEVALAASAVSNGTWIAGGNRFDLVMRAGQAIYVKVTSNTTWAMESLLARVEELGATRRRIGD